MSASDACNHRGLSENAPLATFQSPAAAARASDSENSQLSNPCYRCAGEAMASLHSASNNSAIPSRRVLTCSQFGIAWPSSS